MISLCLMLIKSNWLNSGLELALLTGGLVTHEIEVNVYYRGHVERMRLDVCDLGKTEVILGMPWLAAHNPEINWETGEVKMTRCPPLCGKNKEKKEKQELGKRRKGEVEEEAAIR